MYILQERPKGNFVSHEWQDTKDRSVRVDTIVQATTITDLVNWVIQAEFNPDNNLEWRVINRQPINPIIRYEDKVV